MYNNIRQNILNNIPSRYFHCKGHAPHFTVRNAERNITLKLKHIPGRYPKDKYVFQDLHIHLGRDDSKGSEHAIDGRHYPMEVRKGGGCYKFL